jgi:HD-GYP domain-containing protein (c-di-GMP phosphodiesterase class II)
MSFLRFCRASMQRAMGGTMKRDRTVNLFDLLFSVSEVMDMSDDSLVDHQMRTAFIAGEMAHAARLDYGATERLTVAALLHDIGALSPEEKISAHIFEDLLPETHCERGGKLFREAYWLAPSAQIVEWHHTPIAEHQRLGRTLAEDDVLAAQILFAADHLERAIRREIYILHQRDGLERRIRELTGAEIHSDVLGLFLEASESEHFWLKMVSKHLATHMREENLLRSICADDETLQSIVRVFKDMTDFRSRFTATHSVGVASCAQAIARKMAFSGSDLQDIYLAGMMHDIGKLVVPNSILCKPASLTPEEFDVIRQHPYFTRTILGGVRGFEQIAEWAGSHHERLNGEGYSRHLDRNQLDLGAKVIAVADVATAIAECRPYRGPGEKETILRELQMMAAKNELEPLIVTALADNFDQIMERTRHAQAADEARYRARYAAER